MRSSLAAWARRGASNRPAAPAPMLLTNVRRFMRQLYAIERHIQDVVLGQDALAAVKTSPHFIATHTRNRRDTGSIRTVVDRSDWPNGMHPRSRRRADAPGDRIGIAVGCRRRR